MWEKEKEQKKSPRTLQGLFEVPVSLAIEEFMQIITRTVFQNIRN